MKFKSLEVAKSLRLEAEDAAWLAETSMQHRRSEAEIMRMALRSFRRLAEHVETTGAAEI
jgi:hypothetical protein